MEELGVISRVKNGLGYFARVSGQSKRESMLLISLELH